MKVWEFRGDLKYILDKEHGGTLDYDKNRTSHGGGEYDKDINETNRGDKKEKVIIVFNI